MDRVCICHEAGREREYDASGMTADQLCIEIHVSMRVGFVAVRTEIRRDVAVGHGEFRIQIDERNSQPFGKRCACRRLSSTTGTHQVNLA